MITTLIPAYKPNFIPELLYGLLNQTFKQFKVIISDDSPNNEVSKLIQSKELASVVNQLNLEVINGPKNGSMANISHLITRWDNKTPLVHLLFDDDVIYPLFYQLHVLSHSKNNIAASISLRWAANEQGQPYRTPMLPKFVTEFRNTIEIINEDMLFASAVKNTFNWLGEMSNIVLSANAVRTYEESSHNGLAYYGLSDIGSLLQLSLNNKLSFINHHLGYFRENSLQNTQNKQSISLKCAYIGWISIMLMALNAKKISLDDANLAMSRICKMILKNFPDDQSMLAFAHLPLQAAVNSDKFYEMFKLLWQDVLKQDASWLQSCAMRLSR